MGKYLSSRHIHGMSKTHEYRSWAHMARRCTIVCKGWRRSAPLAFEKFLACMGPCPDNARAELIDRSRGFVPGNVRWRLLPGNGRSAPHGADVAGAKTVALTHGLVALVDAQDFPAVAAYKWLAKLSGNSAYATRKERVGGVVEDVAMHRFILRAPKGALVDHIDGNPLNNRRSNIRLCTATGNARNVVNSKNRRAGGYKGVYWHKRTRMWAAQIGYENGKIYLGVFHDPEVAAKAYDAAARLLFGEFAAPNFPLEAA